MVFVYKKLSTYDKIGDVLFQNGIEVPLGQCETSPILFEPLCWPRPCLALFEFLGAGIEGSSHLNCILDTPKGKIYIFSGRHETAEKRVMLCST